MDERGYIDYQSYDAVTGGLLQSIVDFNTSLSGQPAPPAGWTTPSGGGLNLVTDYTVDSLGRNIQTLGPSHTVSLAGVATTLRTADWTVYQDSLLQTWTARGYATGTAPNYTYTLVNPVSITIFDEEGRVTDQIQAIRDYTAGPLVSTDSFPQSSYCRWTTNQYTDCCKLASTRAYYSIPSSGTGTAGVNYNETDFGYDLLNRQNRVVSPGGTITRTVFDARNMPVSVWVGTNDTGATWLDPTGGGAQGNNMVVVVEKQYDNGVAGGDGVLTQSTEYADAATARVIALGYDWRGRHIWTDGEIDYYEAITLDNLDRAIKVAQYNTTAAGNLARLSATVFDDRGRPCRQIRYAVDPTTGSIGNSLTDNTWYDSVGSKVCFLPAGSSGFYKTAYDAIGRVTAWYKGYFLGTTSYAWAGSVANDTIVEQVENVFDGASNLIQTNFRQRFHNATGTGPLTYPGGTQPQARVSYTLNYPDPIGRTQAAADYGTNGDLTLTPPADVPASSRTVLVTLTAYNSRGEAYQTTDPAGSVTQATFDDAGRRTQLVENYKSPAGSSSSSPSSSSAGSPASDDTNRTTAWTYTADSLIATITAVSDETGNQVTTNVFGTSLPASDVARNDLLSSVRLADGSTLSWLYNRQSQRKQFTDQRGVTHALSFDLLGRQFRDAIVSFLPSSSSSSSDSSTAPTVDSSIQRIELTYEVRSLIQNVTSYSSAPVGQGTVVNDVQRAYNSFEQVITEYQEHNGAVNTSTSANVRYQYADGSSNTIRPTAIVYPDGRQLNLNYGSSGAIDDALSRIVSLIDSDGVTHLADYTRLGAHRFVQQTSAQPQIAWSLINGTGSDPYAGLDQFNRIADSRWYSTATGQDLDRIQHGYDLVGDRLWRRNTVAEAVGVNIDELYGIDGVCRLQQVQRGYLDRTNSFIVSGTLNFAQIWGLDATGNWRQFWQNSTGASWNLQQSRTANQLNEITGITGGGWAQPEYDAAGNTIQMPQAPDPAVANNAVYDAWDRPTSISAAGSLVLQNGYDGLMRRITKIVSGTVRHIYYSGNWQPIEERLGSSSSADRQLVWGLRHIDDLLLRDRGSERFYALQDPNWNVSAICTSSGSISERYLYAPYGQPTFMNAGFGEISSSAYAWETLFGGYRWDVETGYYQVRFRTLHPVTGRWTTLDPVLFRGGMNFFQYGASSPVSYADPLGLDAQPTSNPQPHHWLCVLRPTGQGQKKFDQLCCSKGIPVDIDDFTTDLEDALRGTPHHTLHHACGYTDKCKDTYKAAKDCCDLLLRFLKQIEDGWACLKSKYKGKLPPFGMHPVGGGPDTFFKLLGLTYKACAGKKLVWLPDCVENSKVCLAIAEIDYDQCLKSGGWFCDAKHDLAVIQCHAELIGCQDGVRPPGKPSEEIEIGGIVIDIYDV